MRVSMRREGAQYSGGTKRRQRLGMQTPQRRAAPASGFKNPRALMAASLWGNSRITRCHVCRARASSRRLRWHSPIFSSASAAFAEPGAIDLHLLELGQRLPVVALHVVRLADPVLRVGHERMARVLGDEVQEVEHRLAVLARTERRQRRRVCLLRALGSRRDLARALAARRRRRRRRYDSRDRGRGLRRLAPAAARRAPAGRAAGGGAFAARASASIASTRARNRAISSLRSFSAAATSRESSAAAPGLRPSCAPGSRTVASWAWRSSAVTLGPHRGDIGTQAIDGGAGRAPGREQDRARPRNEQV